MLAIARGFIYFLLLLTIIRQPLTALPKKLAYNWQIFNSLLYVYTTPEACYIVHRIKTGHRFSLRINIGISIASHLVLGLYNS